jgi:hypothetical protein
MSILNKKLKRKIMERKVVIASAKSNAAARTQFSGTTFGELKADAVFAGIYGDGEGVEAIVKPGNVTLRDNASVLPEGEFSVFLVPTKNKAGYDLDTDDISDMVETAVDNVARAKAEEVYNEIKAAIETIVAKHTDAIGATGDDELDAAVREARNL